MKPVFVLIEYNPWQMVIGSDSPSFALYNNGLVIFQKGKEEKIYYSTILNATYKNDLVHRLIPDNISAYKNYYELSEWTDQPTNLFYLKGYKIKAYGDLRNPMDDEEDPFFDETGKKDDLRDQFPDKLLDIFYISTSYDHADAKKWLPDHIELMCWPYSNAPDKSIIWPKDWPGLEDKNTANRGKGSYSIYLPSHCYQELIVFLGTCKQKGAVKINNKKMAVSIRFPFPKEEMWMK